MTRIFYSYDRQTYNTRDRTIIIIIIIDVRESLCKWTAVFNEALHLFSIHSSIVLPDDVCCLFVCVFFAFDYRSLPLFTHFMNQAMSNPKGNFGKTTQTTFSSSSCFEVCYLLPLIPLSVMFRFLKECGLRRDDHNEQSGGRKDRLKIRSSKKRDMNDRRQMNGEKREGWMEKKAEQKPSGSLFKGLVFSRKKTEYRPWFL